MFKSKERWHFNLRLVLPPSHNSSIIFLVISCVFCTITLAFCLWLIVFFWWLRHTKVNISLAFLLEVIVWVYLWLLEGVTSMHNYLIFVYYVSSFLSLLWFRLRFGVVLFFLFFLEITLLLSSFNIIAHII
jgi:hypothetical protein